MAKLINAKQIDQGSLQKHFNLNERISKTIVFCFPLVQDGYLGGLGKFDWDGNIESVDAFCAVTGMDNTVIDIQKIAEEDLRKNLDTWESIFMPTAEMNIPAGNAVQDSSYILSSVAVKKNDLFRVVFKHTGPIGHPIDNLRIRDLTVQIHINI